MGNLKNNLKKGGDPGNFVPAEAIEISENARKPQAPADDAKRNRGNHSNSDPYNEDRVSVNIPSNEEINAHVPDDTVSPG